MMIVVVTKGRDNSMPYTSLWVYAYLQLGESGSALLLRAKFAVWCVQSGAERETQVIRQTAIYTVNRLFKAYYSRTPAVLDDFRVDGFGSFFLFLRPGEIGNCRG